MFTKLSCTIAIYFLIFVLCLSVIIIGFVYGDPNGNSAKKASAYLAYTFIIFLVLVIYIVCCKCNNRNFSIHPVKHTIIQMVNNPPISIITNEI